MTSRGSFRLGHENGQSDHVVELQSPGCVYDKRRALSTAVRTIAVRQPIMPTRAIFWATIVDASRIPTSPSSLDVAANDRRIYIYIYIYMLRGDTGTPLSFSIATNLNNYYCFADLLVFCRFVGIFQNGSRPKRTPKASERHPRPNWGHKRINVAIPHEAFHLF